MSLERIAAIIIIAKAAWTVILDSAISIAKMREAASERRRRIDSQTAES